ncbi:MAG TPA: glycoside hydrolase family 9 protein [Streptosporangiaceae bacterium]|nr:glycoside hydrolase family 9 protein [Streptosporangiaceae bacterium]
MSANKLRTGWARLLIGCAAASLLTGVVSVTAASAAVTGLVRVDQVGFLPGDTKQAYLMTSGAVSGETYAVINSAGTTVASGSVTSTSRGSWNTNYPDVYLIDFSSVTAADTYHIQVSGGVSATSPTFSIASASGLYGKLVGDGVNFFQVQRDGPNVIAGALNRQASHLNDQSASVYATPHFASGSDTITDSSLTKIGGPVDVSGGWADAGDYLKFTYTTAYADTLLAAAQRVLGSSAPATLGAEASYGESWLNKMWDQTSKTLYLQVGIGTGNSTGTFNGDHDIWRLPQADDADSASADKYIKNRPVFEAASPGTAVSPNLAGMVSAAFALNAQNDATSNPTQAAAEYQAATSMYADASTSSPPNPLVTADPNSYYAGSLWHPYMELGAAEIALAAQALGHDASTYLSQAATWASDYIATDTGDTFNLYDPSALAHADLIQAMDNAGDPTNLAVSRTTLINDLKRQLTAPSNTASSNMFHAAGNITAFDVDSHTFGFMTTEALYQKITGDTTYAPFATEQRNWLMGANAWGTSFMVGEGTTFPDCMQHQVANLSGSLNGSAPIATGAVVNGPNNTSQFSGGLGSYETGMKACPANGVDQFSAFDGQGSEFVDDVRSWQTDEPGLDMTGGAVLASALQEAVNSSAPANDFSLAVSPTSGTVTAGQSATGTVSTAITSGSAESITLSATGLPTGATASFSASPINSGASSTLTVATASSTPAGTYSVTVTGTAPSGSHTATYTLTVNAPANDFSLSLSPTSGTVTAGQSATSTVSTAVTAGSAESVTLSAAGLPSGATASFGTSLVTSGGSSSLTIATTSSTPAGTYPVTVTGTASSGSHTATYTLTVNAAANCTAAQLMGDPGFENGTTNVAPWTQSSTLGFSPITGTSSAEPAHSGSFEAWFNGNGSADTDTEAQPVSIPAGCTTANLSFWLHVDTTENTTTATPDTFKVQLLNSAGTVLTTLATFSNLSHNTGYTQHTYDVSAYDGQTVTVKFTGTETDANGGTTDFVLDDTALNVSGTVTNGFSLSLSPTSGTVTAGQSATSTVSTAVTSGNSEAVTLSTSGLPIGATASFSTSPVNSGSNSTLTIATTSSTPTGTYPVTVTGTDASGTTHSATYTLTVNSGAGCTAAQLLGDPGFENGTTNIAPWVQSSTVGSNPITGTSSAEPAHSGSYEAWLNGDGVADTDSVEQTVTVPAGCTTATLSFWLHIDTTENTTTATPDKLRVQLLTTGGTVITTLATFSNLNANTGYAQYTYNLSSYIGQTFKVKWIGTETDANGGTTDFVVDDTALNVN